MSLLFEQPVQSPETCGISSVGYECLSDKQKVPCSIQGSRIYEEIAQMAEPEGVAGETFASFEIGG